MPLFLVLALIVVPIAEIWLIVQVGQAIGATWTILLLLGDAFLGAWLIRREGRRAWIALRERVRSGGMPGKELVDGALILVGGTLLLTPGFLTDVVGFFLVLPVTRPIARRLLTGFAKRYFTVIGPTTPTPGRKRPGGGFSNWDSGGDVIPGEVVDDD